jgi:transposase
VDGTLPAGARHDLTDEQWAILAPLLPVSSRRGRPRRWTLRQLIDGIRFRTRVGCPWRDVPERYGTWQSVYGLFRAWQLAGVWAAILTGLQAASAEAGLIEWVVSVDSTVNRAHQHAAGARRHPEAQRTPPVGEPADHALGRSRGGLSTKVHLAVEQGRKPLATAGDLELRIPKLRTGSFFPSLLERRRRVDQALLAVVMEAYLHGVSTRRVDDLVRALGADTGISKSEVSRICADLDAEVSAFRDRSLAEQAFPVRVPRRDLLQGAGRPAGGLPGGRHRHRRGRRRAPGGARLRRR